MPGPRHDEAMKRNPRLRPVKRVLLIALAIFTLAAPSAEAAASSSDSPTKGRVKPSAATWE